MQSTKKLTRRAILGKAAAMGAGLGVTAGAFSAAPLLAPTPPMGWMSWNQFGPEISEQLIHEIAEAMISNGMRKAGYQYICIDDLWHGGRDKSGYLHPDSKRFPNGMKAVADYVHAKGFKLGIYSDAADRTCAKQPGSYGYEKKDAERFASWGIDYLKYDYCYAPEDRATAIRRYGAMAEALRVTGRPIVFAVCEWGERQPWLWARKAGGQLWRTTWDIRDTWKGNYNVSQSGILDILDRQAGLEQYAGPGGWNDPDMLVIGLYGKGMYTSRTGFPPCNDTEYRSQMSLWSMLAAPLLATSDLRKMNAATREILTNREVIALNQDPLGKQAARVGRDGDLEIFKKPLSGGHIALALLNRGHGSAAAQARWADLGLKGKYEVRDLWAKKNLGVFDRSISVETPSHGTAVLRLKPV